MIQHCLVSSHVMVHACNYLFDAVIRSHEFAQGRFCACVGQAAWQQIMHEYLMMRLHNKLSEAICSLPV